MTDRQSQRPATGPVGSHKCVCYDQRGGKLRRLDPLECLAGAQGHISLALTGDSSKLAIALCLLVRRLAPAAIQPFAAAAKARGRVGSG